MTLIDDKHAQLGGDKGALGKPSSQEAPLGKADKWTVRRFAKGSIYADGDRAYAVYGAIHKRYEALGLDGGYGRPQTDELVTPRLEGRWNRFGGGTIVWRDGVGTRIVQGWIRDKWEELGGFRSSLGHPVSDETTIAGGFCSHFTGGSVYSANATGAHAIYGKILATWKQLGAESSTLGYPVTDELPTADGSGRFTRFQHGTIVWTPSGGTKVVS